MYGIDMHPRWRSFKICTGIPTGFACALVYMVPLRGALQGLHAANLLGRYDDHNRQCLLIWYEKNERPPAVPKPRAAAVSRVKAKSVKEAMSQLTAT